MDAVRGVERGVLEGGEEGERVLEEQGELRDLGDGRCEGRRGVGGGVGGEWGGGGRC